ncbi:SDR family NAD(P)-dependent oxidoreductase [Aspergillus ibericus CBS 121593]|uniref:Short chain dehydrogenase n=1 Tax=Aspergillus ibericus CBS 121593 TaxID=1448316 RepID=A0A395GTQ4_9EURO|nr:short chain dehydrogenase [Aspergillus ibericus CBS 121593]RAK98782.1 short chain dehydrogenase [Aspergillus ibericus CBS 121593]
MALASIKLDGGTALVTGTASGIGKEVAFAFAEAGAHAIVLVDLHAPDIMLEKCRQYAAHPDLRLLPIAANITVEKDVENMVQSAISAFGRIDYCVHSAGIGCISRAPTERLDVEAFQHTMTTNASGTMLVLRAVSNLMAKQEPRTYTSPRSNATRSLGRGAIVVISSIPGIIASPDMMPYTVSKHAVIAIAKTAAVDNFRHNIRVNIVDGLSWIKGLRAMSALQRAAVPEEVADAIVFLCSPAATFINGSALVIDAGMTLTALRSNL